MPADKQFRSILIIAILLGFLLLTGVLLLVHPGVLKTVSDQAQDESIRVARYLINEFRPQEQLRRQQPLSAEFIAHCHQARLDFNLVKIKFFDSDGITIFSTTPADIGVHNTHAFFREQVMAGEIVAKTVERHQASLEKEKYGEHLVETYIPLMEQGRFLGAFEIYYNITDRFYHLRRLLTLTFNALLFTILVFWGGLLLALRRAGQHLALLEQARGELDSRNQELQRRGAELARSNAELTDFAHIASHDLQEPLRTVIAFGDRLRLKCGEMLGERGRDYLARMQQAAERMQGLIEDLLQYARVTTKGREFEPVDLNEVMGEVLGDLESVIEETAATIVVGPLPVVRADRHQMRSLLQNLLSNALKYRHPEIAPEIRVEKQRGDKDWVEIVVSDNGIGFDDKYLKRIFRPFQRLHGHSEYQGSGIGLAVCKKIVDRHGGELTAHGTPGVGASFVIRLPC